MKRRPVDTIRVRPLTPAEQEHARAVVEEHAPELVDMVFGEEE